MIATDAELHRGFMAKSTACGIREFSSLGSFIPTAKYIPSRIIRQVRLRQNYHPTKGPASIVFSLSHDAAASVHCVAALCSSRCKGATAPARATPNLSSYTFPGQNCHFRRQGRRFDSPRPGHPRRARGDHIFVLRIRWHQDATATSVDPESNTPAETPPRRRRGS